MTVIFTILGIIGAIWIFIVLIPAIRMTNAQMRDLGDKSGYLKYEDLEVQAVRNKHAKEVLIKKYLKKGFNAYEADILADEELQNYLENND